MVRIVERLNYCFLRRAKRRRNWRGSSDRNGKLSLSQLTAVGMMAPRSRSILPCGGGVNGGVMVAMFEMCNIL